MPTRRAFAAPSPFGMRPTILGALLAAGCTLVAAPARAQTIQRLSLRGEAGVALMLPDFQNQTLDQHWAVQGHLHLGVNLIDALAVQASFGSWYFPGNNAGQVYSLLLGLRLQPRVGTLGRFFLDAGAGLGQTAELSRFSFEAGVGFEFAVHDAIDLGPVVRYGHVFHSSEDYPSDAQYLSLGLSVSLHMPPPPPPPVVTPTPTDGDGDGIPDADDVCPREPAGEHPDTDPARRGCPMHDQDNDGVFDRDDLCPTVAAGEHPDPDRAGCPAPDADNDGVFDRDDQCPTTPAGRQPDPERRGCPDNDDDGDRVLNHDDQCPTTPAGLNPDPDPARHGCPLPDRDRDSVPDPTDACPDQPGSPNRDPRRNGCNGLVLVQGGTIRILQPVYFARGSDVVLPRSVPLLTAIAEAMRVETGIHRMSINGHTDDVGDDAANLDLSQRRANSVMNWLSAHGVDANRLEAHGYGETRPVVDISTLRGRALSAARSQNRRVEFRITDPATDATPLPVATPHTRAPAQHTRPHAPAHRAPGAHH